LLSRRRWPSPMQFCITVDFRWTQYNFTTAFISTGVDRKTGVRTPSGCYIRPVLSDPDHLSQDEPIWRPFQMECPSWCYAWIKPCWLGRRISEERVVRSYIVAYVIYDTSSTS
jgi:hypothetical protein